MGALLWTKVSMEYLCSLSFCTLHPHPRCSILSHPPSTRHALDIFSYEIPSINVNLDSLIDEFSGAPCRRSLPATEEAAPEEERLATTL